MIIAIFVMSTVLQSELNPCAKIFNPGETCVLTTQQYNDKQRANALGLQYKEDLDSLIGTRYRRPYSYCADITGIVYDVDNYGNILVINDDGEEYIRSREYLAKYSLCENNRLLPSCYLVKLDALPKKKHGYTREDLVLEADECFIKFGMTRVLLEERMKGYSKTSIHPGILYDSFTIPLNLVDKDPDNIQRSLIENHLFNFLLPYVVREPPGCKCEWLIVNKSLLSDPGFKTAWYNFKQKYGLL